MAKEEEEEEGKGEKRKKEFVDTTRHYDSCVYAAAAHLLHTYTSAYAQTHFLTCKRNHGQGMHFKIGR